MSFWRNRARRLIAELTRDLPETATVAERRKALWGKGYPAHEGANWGRKMWGLEVRKYLARHGDATGRVSGKPVNWPADVHFPFRADPVLSETARIADCDETSDNARP